MPKVLTTGTQCRCSFGAAPSVLIARPGPGQGVGMPVVTIDQIVPGANIPPFGVCRSLANPAVAAATAAAQGALTPQPCMPVVAAPWAPGSTTNSALGIPVATEQSKCMCSWGGVISVSSTPNFPWDAN